MNKKSIDSIPSTISKEQEKGDEKTEISAQEEAILQKIASILVDLVIEEQQQKLLQSQKE